jgi:small subunit ribosomal protein S24e
MEVEIKDKKENPLLNRTEIWFKIAHDAAATPAKKDVREALAKMTNSQKERVVVDHMNTVFGKGETVGYAKVYKSKQDAVNVERSAVKIRHGLAEPKKKGEKKEGEAAAAPAAEAKPAEAPAPAPKEKEKK